MLYFCAVQYCTGLRSLTGGIKSPRRGRFFGYAKGRLLGDVFPDQRCRTKFTDENGRGQQTRDVERVFCPLKSGGEEGKREPDISALCLYSGNRLGVHLT